MTNLRAARMYSCGAPVTWRPFVARISTLKCFDTGVTVSAKIAKVRPYFF